MREGGEETSMISHSCIPCDLLDVLAGNVKLIVRTFGWRCKSDDFVAVWCPSKDKNGGREFVAKQPGLCSTSE